jgi:hypothetical protein
MENIPPLPWHFGQLGCGWVCTWPKIAQARRETNKLTPRDHNNKQFPCRRSNKKRRNPNKKSPTSSIKNGVPCHRPDKNTQKPKRQLQKPNSNKKLWKSIKTFPCHHRPNRKLRKPNRGLQKLSSIKKLLKPDAKQNNEARELKNKTSPLLPLKQKPTKTK